MGTLDSEGILGSNRPPNREGDKEFKSSFEEAEVSQSTIYRRIFKGALAAGALYAGYKQIPKAANFILDTVINPLSSSSPVFNTARSQFISGQAGAAVSTIFNGMKNASYEDLRWATSPIRYAFGARAPSRLRALQTTRKLIEGKNNNIRPIAESWRALKPASAHQLSLRQVFENNLFDFAGNAIDLTEDDYYSNDSLRGGLKDIRRELLSLQNLANRRKMSRGLFEKILSAPVDRAIFTRKSRIFDARFMDPEHLFVTLPERAAIPNTDTFKGSIPWWIPGFGGKDYDLRGARPLAWLSQLTAPVELLRRDPTVRVFSGVALKKASRKGKPNRYLYANKNVYKMHIYGSMLEEDDDGVRNWITHEIDMGSEKDTFPSVSQIAAAGYSFPRYSIDKIPIMTNAKLVRATSSIGKGARLRRGDYQHNFVSYLAEKRINPQSWLGKAIKVGEKIGIGPQFTSLEMGEDPVTHATTSRYKVSALENLYRQIKDLASQGPAGLHTPPVKHASVIGDDRFNKFTAVADNQPWTKALGKFVDHKHAGKYAQSLADFANYSLMRPFYLLEGGLGIGLRPGKTPLHTLGNILGKVALPAYAAFQGLNYADYLAGHVLPGGSPSDLALGAYAGAQTARQRGNEALKLDQLARKLEEVLPGSVSSPLSGISRSVIGGGVGAMLGGAITGALSQTSTSMRNKVARILIPIVAAFIGSVAFGADPTVSSESLRRRYAGEELVPIKRGRFWELGKDSYYGRDTMYYRPHYIAMHKNRTWYKSTYGSEDAYWAKGTYFPTPHNMFGAGKLADPYFLEKKNMASRPYPVSAGVFSEVPIIGPGLEATIGRVLKPKWEHPLYRESARSFFAQDQEFGKLPVDISERMGLPPIQQSTKVSDRTSLFGAMSRAGDTVGDWLGLQGFLWKGAAGKTGVRDIGSDARQAASSDQMASTESWFYNLELGGGFQTFGVPGADLFATEFIRRFIPRREQKMDLFNPIPNDMPSWLPGPRSDFEKDRNFYIEGGFHTGDPYKKVAMGEVRLPGPGYESTRPLHSGVAGQYSEVDRALILEDVAPFSQSAKYYRALADQSAKEGLLNDFWKRQLLESTIRKEEKIKSKGLGAPDLWQAPGSIEMPVTVDRVISPTEFTSAGVPYPIKLAGIEGNADNAIYRDLNTANNVVYEKAAANVAGLRNTLRERLEALRGQTINVQIARDQAARYDNGKLLAIVPGISQEYFDTSLGIRDEPGLATYLRGGTGTRAVASLYRGVGTTLNQLPGPLAWPANKMLPMKDPVEDYFQNQILSDRFGDWERPVESFLAPWTRQVRGYFQDFVPGVVEDRRFREQQFANLDFVKNVSNMNLAKSYGDRELESAFYQQAKTNYLGINPTNQADQYRYARRSMFAEEQPYYDAFVKLKSSADRERALALLPEQGQYILTNVWASQMPKGETFESKTLSLAANRYNPSKYPREQLDEFMSSTPLPDGNWQGYDPRVTANDMKVKYMENQADNIHNYGLWESDQKRQLRLFPTLTPPNITPNLFSSQTTYQNNLAKLGLTERDFMRTAPVGAGYRDVDVKVKKGKRQSRIDNGYTSSAFN